MTLLTYSSKPGRTGWLRRSFLLGALLTVFVLQSAPAVHAQVPRMISYQGKLVKPDGSPATGSHSFAINYYDPSGVSVFAESFSNIPVVNGVFNIILGSSRSGGFPPTMTFNQPYKIGVAVDGEAELPRTDFESSPYALNAGSVNGFSASTTPGPNTLVVLDNTGKIDPSVLPVVPGGIKTINGLNSNASGDFQINGGTGISVSQDPSTHGITINGNGAGTITGVLAGNGLTGGGSSGNVSLAIAQGGITNDLIAPGAVTGRSLDSRVAGLGLYQDQLGDLNVGVDNQTIRIFNNKLMVGTIGFPQIDSTIQRRVTGFGPPGTFINSINPNGSVNSGAVFSDSSLTRTLFGDSVRLANNPNYSNSYNVTQNFRGIRDSGTFSQNGSFQSTGTAAFTDSTITFGGARLQNVGTPTMTNDAATKGYIDSLRNVVGPGRFTTLNSSGNSQIGDSIGALANRFGTGGNAPAVMNTFGSTGLGSTNTFNGQNIFNGLVMTDSGLTNIGPFTQTGNITQISGNNTLHKTTIDTLIAGTGTITYFRSTGTAAFTDSSITFGGARLQNIGTPTAATDAASKGYIDSLRNVVGPGRFTTLNSSGNSQIGDSIGALANRFGTGGNAPAVRNTFGSTGLGSFNTINGQDTINGRVTANNGLRVTDSLINYFSPGPEANAIYATSYATGAANHATGLVAEASSGGSNSGRPGANAVLGVAKWTGGTSLTTQIIGVVGKAEPNAGVTAIGTLGEADTANVLGNTGVVGFARNSTSSNVGVLGAATASNVQLQALATTSPTAGVYAYNPALTNTNSFALQTNGQSREMNTAATGAEVNTNFTTSIATGGATRATGLVAEATSNATGQTRPSANAILGVAKWSGAPNGTDNIAGVVGKAEPNNGVTALGVIGQATGSNLAGNTGVLGFADSSTFLNVGVTGATRATTTQLAALAGIPANSGLYGYNPTTIGAAITADAPQSAGFFFFTTGVALDVKGGSIRSSATGSSDPNITSNRFADVVDLSAFAGGGIVGINNSLVQPNSTIILTYENSSGAAVGETNIFFKSFGFFVIQRKGPVIAAGDKLDYMIVNH